MGIRKSGIGGNQALEVGALGFGNQEVREVEIRKSGHGGFHPNKEGRAYPNKVWWQLGDFTP